MLQQLEANIISRLGKDSDRFLQIVTLLDTKLSAVMAQMVEAREDMDASSEALSQMLLGKLARSPELMQLKEGIGAVGADIKLIQDQNQKILDRIYVQCKDEKA